MPWISLSIWLPLLGGLLVIALGDGRAARSRSASRC